MNRCASDFRALAREISVDNQSAEPGQLSFEWFIDGNDVHIYERYQDSVTGLFHGQRCVDNFASRFLGMCIPNRMSVYGDPGDELRTAPAGFNPRYLEALAG